MKIIDLPDGTEAEFPDDMDDAAISAVLQRQFGGPKAQVQPEEVYGLPGGKDLAPPEQPMSAIPGVDAAMKATVGAGKSIGDTIVKAARFASMSPMSPFGLARTMAEKVLPTGSMEQQDEALKRVEGVLAPSNPTESTAKGLTDFATMLAPVPGLQGGGVARAALGAALPTAIKSGGDPLETATAGVFGAGMHGLGRAIAMPFASKARPLRRRRRLSWTLRQIPLRQPTSESSCQRRPTHHRPSCHNSKPSPARCSEDSGLLTGQKPPSRRWSTFPSKCRLVQTSSPLA